MTEPATIHPTTHDDRIKSCQIFQADDIMLTTSNMIISEVSKFPKQSDIIRILEYCFQYMN